MSRFFKSAAFPILLVILLAFFVQNLFYGSSGSEKMTFNAFQRAVEQGQIGDTITVKTKDLVVVGKLKSGKSFEVGFTQAFNIEEFLLANNVSSTPTFRRAPSG